MNLSGLFVKHSMEVTQVPKEQYSFIAGKILLYGRKMHGGPEGKEYYIWDNKLYEMDGEKICFVETGETINQAIKNLSLREE